MSKFTHLHLHTEHSMLDGINRVETLPEYVRDTLGQKACAITDHGTVSGSYRFYKSCTKAGIKPILGMEAYYAVGDRSVREKDHLGRNYHHLVLLALNNTGLHNLYKLSSGSYTSGMYYKPRIDDALIAEYSEGISATSACLGSYSSQLILRGEVEAAERLLDHHGAMFKNRFFIEVQLHTGKEQQLLNKTLIEIAARRNWPLLLTNDCHYTHQEDKQLHEETLCMQTGSLMSHPPYNHESKSEGSTGKTRFSFGDIDVHVAHHDWMWEQAQLQGIPYEAISNTMALEAMVDASDYFSDRRNRYPHFKGLPDDLPPWKALYDLAHAGLHKRFGGTPPQKYTDRVNHEYKIIKKMGFYDYLLIVRELQQGARGLDVLIGPGRGSVAGSLVAWALKITEVDPLKYGLVFERWLNPGRAARPLLLNRAMIKQIEELPDGSRTNCLSCGDANCSGHNTVRDTGHDNVYVGVSTHEEAEESDYGLGTNLLKCFHQGLSITV